MTDSPNSTEREYLKDIASSLRWITFIVCLLGPIIIGISCNVAEIAGRTK